jgi:hypothetical protein
MGAITQIVRKRDAYTADLLRVEIRNYMFALKAA